MGQFARHRLAAVGLGIIAMLAVVALASPLLAPHDPAFQDLSAVLESPGRKHLLGTDFLGRDVLSRLLVGARTSLSVGVVATVIALAIGVPLGAVSGLLGGRVDNYVMRLTDIAYAFPDLLLILLLRAILGGSLVMVFIAIGLAGWAPFARLVRGQILSLREREFVTAARSTGAGPVYLLWRHLVPNALGPVIVAAAFAVPRAIFAEAALSYIGIGVQPPTPSWGSMAQEGYTAVFTAPYLVAVPAAAIAVVMMAFTFVGDGLRDLWDRRATYSGTVWQPPPQPKPSPSRAKG